ncbi:MAG: hypothetical protein K6D92_04420 [Erysipelotrichaceae bacterium]|nr:hypothetical protein [Erysipelotrichaceae bacterium]
MKPKSKRIAEVIEETTSFPWRYLYDGEELRDLDRVDLYYIGFRRGLDLFANTMPDLRLLLNTKEAMNPLTEALYMDLLKDKAECSEAVKEGLSSYYALLDMFEDVADLLLRMRWIRL